MREMANALWEGHTVEDWSGLSAHARTHAHTHTHTQRHTHGDTKK